MRFHLALGMFVFPQSPLGYSLSQQLGNFHVQSNGDSLEVTHRSAPTWIIWKRKTTPGWLRWAQAETMVKSNQGQYDISAKVKRFCDTALTPSSTELEGQTLVIRYPLEGAALGEMRMQILGGATRYSGRQKPLPAWFHAEAIVGMQGGTQKVREDWQKLQDQNTPVAGFWLQDWEGKRRTSFGSRLWWNWELDRDLNSGWETLRADFSQNNIRLLGCSWVHVWTGKTYGTADRGQTVKIEAPLGQIPAFL